MTYQAPIADMHFVATRLAGYGAISELSGDEDLNDDLLATIFEEGGKFAAGALAPLYRTGDVQGSRLENGTVLTPDGWAEVYRQFVDNGWNAVPFDPEYGGQGLPWLIATGLFDLWHSANMAFALCPMLTLGAVESVDRYASAELKAIFLAKMVSGEWTGTMQLTEPQAGSDLAQVRTKAVKDGQHFRLFGQKSFITYGDHEMTDNIIHMVLARTPDAPEGVKGISLFIVPKYLVNDDGSIGPRNEVRCVSLEEKLGIHASPTAMMSFGEKDGAVGYLVGEENQGLFYMFTMMNSARLSVGMQGIAIAERAYQKAASFARERIQGRDVASPSSTSVAIVRHPDVRRMLMTMRALVEASRALAYYTAGKLDISVRHPETATRAEAESRLDFLIPIVKGWGSEIGSESAWNSVQIHGGMGYVEETGAAQFMRDAKIAEIYEGANGIQAMDLIGRKLARDGGAEAMKFIAEMQEVDSDLADAGEDLSDLRQSLKQGVHSLENATNWLLASQKADMCDAAAGAMPYLRLCGVVAGGWQMARAALAAKDSLSRGVGDPEFLKAKLVTAKFYGDRILPRVFALESEISSGAASVMALPDEAF